MFAEVHDRLAESTEGILVITVSSRLSGTYDVAVQSVDLMKRKCRVEVLDSLWATMAQGFIVMEAAEAAKQGVSLDEAAEEVKKTMSRVDFLSTFDTLEYLRRGGRIGKAAALLGSMLKVNPLITLRDGVVEPAGRVRSRAKAIERLYESAVRYSRVEALAVEDTACPDEAEELARRLRQRFSGIPVYRSRMTPAIGTHTGSGLRWWLCWGTNKGKWFATD